MEALSVKEANESISNSNICKSLGAAIHRANPHRRWYVEVIDRGRVAIIKIPELSMDWGMIVHLNGLLETDIKRCIHSAAELLERFNLTRGRSDNHDLMSMERNYKGVLTAKSGES